MRDELDDATTQVTFVLLPRFSTYSVTAAIEPMRAANFLASRDLYRWEFRSAAPGEVVSSGDLPIPCAPLTAPGAGGLILVCGSWGAERYREKALLSWLRAQARRRARLVGMELGVYPLAEAGLLDGGAAALHWSWLPGFAERFPDVEALEQLYTIEGRLMTCAGATAALDLMLQVIRADHGPYLAAEVANQMLYFPCRSGDAAQRQVLSTIDRPLHPVVKAAIKELEGRIDEPIGVPALAQMLNVSQRQLERLFRRDVGCTVVQFAKLVRLQHARVLLTSTSLSIREVSVACGFNSMSHFSLSFSECFGKKPSEYRQTWPEDEQRPSWPGTAFAFVNSSLRPLRRPPGAPG